MQLLDNANNKQESKSNSRELSESIMVSSSKKMPGELSTTLNQSKVHYQNLRSSKINKQKELCFSQSNKSKILKTNGEVDKFMTSPNISFQEDTIILSKSLKKTLLSIKK